VPTGHYRAGAPSADGKPGPSVAVCGELDEMDAHVPFCNSPTSTALSCRKRVDIDVSISRPS
jgi:hypothetical protein